jgi:hypothetical protein
MQHLRCCIRMVETRLIASLRYATAPRLTVVGGIILCSNNATPPALTL